MATDLRNTRQKDAIRAAFLNANRPLSPEETLAHARQQVARISIATIYRNIASLVQDKWLTAVEIPGEATRYEVAGKEHHHHFQCNDCGKVFELAGCTVQATHGLPSGFRVTGHEFFLYGLCAECQ